MLGPLADGIARWDGRKWRTIGKANGLPLTGNVVRMIFDAAGDPWIATRGERPAACELFPECTIR